jgi:hypothetical protein
VGGATVDMSWHDGVHTDMCGYLSGVPNAPADSPGAGMRWILSPMITSCSSTPCSRDTRPVSTGEGRDVSS